MEAELFGVRISTGNKVAIKASKEGDLHVAQSLPYGTVLTAKGQGYQAMSVSSVNALIVRPGVTAAFTLWNGESGGGKSYIIERIMAFHLLSTAAQTFASVWACVHPVGMSAVVADITAIKSTRGKANYGGNARLDIGATVVDDGWFPWGVSSEAEEAGVLPGGVMCPQIGGRMVIPPTAGVSMQVVSGVVGDKFTHGFHWYEVQLDLT